GSAAPARRGRSLLARAPGLVTVLRPQRPRFHGAHHVVRGIVLHGREDATAYLLVGEPPGAAPLHDEAENHLAIPDVRKTSQPFGRAPGPVGRVGRRASPDVKEAT